jgi:hypothetical protein
MTPNSATDAARQVAAEALRPHADDPAIAEIIAALAGEDEGEDDARLEKAMTTISVARDALIKDKSVTPAQAFEVGQRLERAEKALQRECMLKHSKGYRDAEVNNAESERLRERNFGRAA